MKACQFVVAACLVWVMLCQASPSCATIPSGMEERLDKWQPGPEHAQVPMKSIRCLRFNIAGHWVARHSGHCTTSLSITRSRPGLYKVEFKTFGCVGDWQLARTGRYSDGALTLNSPVEEYVARTYKRLYPVRIAGKEYLLPSAAVKKVQQAISDDGSTVLDPGVLQWHLFSRRPAQRVFTPRGPFSRVGLVIMVCAGAGLVVFILLTTFSGKSLASTKGSLQVPTGCRRRPWDELTSSPQF